MPKTFAPDSVAASTIFGVYTSVNPSPVRWSRKPATLAAAISKPARSSGCRSVVGEWSSIVGRPAGSGGRYRANGGGRGGAGGRGGDGVGGPGACWCAVTVPSTAMTVSSVSAPPSASMSPSACVASSTAGTGPDSTTWASPERSLTIRNVTDLSSRRRCSQPAIVTRSPTCPGRSAARIREIIALLQGYARPLGSAGEKGTRGATALSPPPGRPAAASISPSRGQGGGALG